MAPNKAFGNVLALIKIKYNGNNSTCCQKVAKRFLNKW